MTDLVPPTRRPPPDDTVDVARTLDMLATAVMILLTVGTLYFAREILVPVAIAVLLSFVLSPPVRLLRRLGLGKKLAVGVVVLLTFVVACGLGAILARQISELAADAPRYQATVSQKVERIRHFSETNPLLAKLNSAITAVTQNAPARGDGAKPAVVPSQPEAPKPMAVEVVQPPPGVLTLLQSAAGVVAAPLITAVFVAIFIVFILMQREDLRNRFIRLAGSRDLQRTTLAMNDAARRLSRYFLAQVLLNAGFGVVTAIALTIIGVPSAILWGIVATFLRFIPYVGSIGSALFPVLVSLAASSGWTMALQAAIFFAATEFVTGQVIEPLVYGHNTGISPFAVVLSATFWTWLWGPIGLVLATPLTVCVVVMGRHVERLGFLDVLLGDAPPLTEVEAFYQRMLSGDASEVYDHADRYLAEHSLLAYCDNVAMKALLMAQIDVRRGALSEDRQQRILATMRDLAEDLADRDDPPGAHLKRGEALASLEDDPLEGEDRDPEHDLPHDVAIAPDWAREGAVLCVSGRTPLDEAAAHLLADLLKQRGIGAMVEPASSLVDGDGEKMRDHAPCLVLLSFLDADLSVAQARFAVRRLRRRVPDVQLAAAFWMEADDERRAAGLCHDVRSDTCVASLPQAIRLCLDRGASQGAAAPERNDGENAADSQQSMSALKEAI